MSVFTRFRPEENAGKWVFLPPLSWVQQGQEEKVLALAAQHGMEDFYAEKYLDTLRVGAGTEPDELFDKSHGFYIAVIQGFFRDYFYTRGSAFSFLVEQKPEYARYFTPWEQIVPAVFPNPAENRIIENYCSGVYLSPDQAAQLLQDLEQLLRPHHNGIPVHEEDPLHIGPVVAAGHVDVLQDLLHRGGPETFFSLYMAQKVHLLWEHPMVHWSR